MMGDYDVELINDSMQEFYATLKGPKDSPYEGGIWKIHVELPEGYPYKSPSVVRLAFCVLPGERGRRLRGGGGGLA